jgi:hypothetical protein
VVAREASLAFTIASSPPISSLKPLKNRDVDGTRDSQPNRVRKGCGMGKIIELSDQQYAIMAAAAAERGESADTMMTRWLRDLASGSMNPNEAEAPDAIPPVAIKASSASGTAWQRAHGPLAVALIVLTCFAFIGSVLSVWVNQQLLNTDNFVSAVSPLLKNPEVIDSVSAYVAAQVVEALDVQGRVANALPDRASFLAVPVTNQLQTFAQTRIARLMQTDQFHAAWARTLTFLHSKVVGILRGDSKYLSIQGNALTIDLTLVISDALRYLHSQLPDLVQSKLPIPDLSNVTVPAEARAKLSEALGRPLPDDFGQVTIMESDQLVTAQRTVQLLDALVIILPILTLLLLIAAIAVSPHHRRTVTGTQILTGRQARHATSNACLRPCYWLPSTLPSNTKTGSHKEARTRSKSSKISGRPGGTRTPTLLSEKRILSPLCLPFHHRPRMESSAWDASIILSTA